MRAHVYVGLGFEPTASGREALVAVARWPAQAT
jgi:hypothetical protein